ncbi:hypothetical protein PT974_07032 [Cladobotryum mycophilum]|uniref:DUF7907 domain-containing protein n=1 Tax=Cladobotryum mycophilum TaxID=491253 RepID=A0ABR0SN27_9HYPO
MLASALTLGLVGLAAASPISNAYYPPPPSSPVTQSKGFLLVVKHTNTPINGLYINSIHVGAGLGLVGVGTKDDNPRIFYQNGTAEEYATGQSSIISDGGTPPFPFGLSFVKDEGSAHLSTVNLNGGQGTKGIAISKASVIVPGEYLVCDEPLQYYQGKHFNILKNLSAQDPIPKECTAVTLVPQCTELNDLPKGSYSSHDFAIDTPCYKDAGTVN